MWALSFTTILLSTTPCLMDAPNTEALALGLKTYVDDAGDVDYRRLAVEKTEAFTSFLDAVSGLCPEAFSRQSRDQKIALLLNFYNAWVIDFMTGTDGRPGSILKVRVRGQSVFDAPIISVRWHEKPLTLNLIEKVLFCLVYAPTLAITLLSSVVRRAAPNFVESLTARSILMESSKPRQSSFSKTVNETNLRVILGKCRGFSIGTRVNLGDPKRL